MTATTNRYGDLLQEFYQGIKDNNLSDVRLMEIQRIFNELWDREQVYDTLLSGSGIIRLAKLNVANDDVYIDQFGIFFKNQEGEIGFQDLATGGYYSIIIYSDGDDGLILKNSVGGKTVSMLIDTATHNVMQVDFVEDNTEQLALLMNSAATTGTGELINMGDVLIFTSQGDSASSPATSIIMTETVDPSTEFITQDVQAQIYIRANKFIIRWSDGGTVRYKYLDLTGTGVTWTHTTTPP